MTQAAKPPEEPIRYHAVVDLPIDKIIPSPDNPRKIKAGDKAITELVESIKATGGVIVPVIVRVHPAKPGMYDLRAGACRLMACTIAGFTTIKAEVMEMDDRLAKEITAIENLKRKDLTPMEEAEGIAVLMATAANPNDIEHLAATLGWSIGKVYRRMAIATLTEKWRKALAIEPSMRRGPGAYGQWGAGHMELIARYDPTIQDQLFDELKTDWDAPRWSVDNLRKYLGEKFLLIKQARWNPGDETLFPEAGACANCPKRSSNTPHLFEELDEGKTGSGDRCLGPTCWNKKAQLYVDRRAAELKAEHTNLIFLTDENIYGEKEKALKKRFPNLRPLWHYRNAKEGDKGTMPAMIVNGSGAGAVKWVRLDRDLAGSNQPTKAKGADGKLTMAARRERLNNRRSAHAIESLKEKLDKYNLSGSPIKDTATLLALLTAFGTTEKNAFRNDRGWKLYDDILHGDPSSFLQAVWKQLCGVFLIRLHLYAGVSEATDAIPEAKKIAHLTGIGFDVLLAEAVTAIPEPKSWAAAKPEKETKSDKTLTLAGSGKAAAGRTEREKPTAKDIPLPSAGAAKPKAKKLVKGVCRVCGCTETTPCVDKVSGDSCAWADKTQTLCTTCKDKAAIKAAKQKKGVKPVEPKGKNRKGGKGC